jgi:hypothetical protein
MLCHEATDTSNRRVLPKTGDLSVRFNSVILEGLKGNRLVDTLSLFRLGVNLLLTLLTTTTKTKHKMESGFLLNVVVTQRATIFQLLSSEN